MAMEEPGRVRQARVHRVAGVAVAALLVVLASSACAASPTASPAPDTAAAPTMAAPAATASTPDAAADTALLPTSTPTGGATEEPEPADTPAEAGTATPTPAGTVTSTATSTPAATPTPTPPAVATVPPTSTAVPPALTPAVEVTTVATEAATPPGGAGLAITGILLRGTGSAQPDEYIQITNTGDSPLDMSGWTIDAGHDDQYLVFHRGFVLGPGETCRLYTNQVEPDSCGGRTFGHKRPILNNEGDCGRVHDAAGALIVRRCVERDEP